MVYKPMVLYSKIIISPWACRIISTVFDILQPHGLVLYKPGLVFKFLIKSPWANNLSVPFLATIDIETYLTAGICLNHKDFDLN